MPKLTEELVEALPVNGRDRIIFEGAGFGVRVTRTGRKIFIAQARVRGVHVTRTGRKVRGAVCRVSVGTFPEMKVRDARADALAATAAIRRGDDPKAARTERAKAVEAGATTVSDFGERWLADHVRLKRKPRTIEDYERLVEQKIKPALGHLLVSRVAREDVLELHADMSATPRRANYTVSTFRAMMRYAEDCGLRPPMTNPARRIEMYRERAKERFLSEEEIAKAAEAIAAAEHSKKIGPHAAAGLRLALFTGARSGEITAAQWAHVDWERKLIRLPDSKTNEPRTIHLSDAALEILKTLPRVGKFIVAGAKKDSPTRIIARLDRGARVRRPCRRPAARSSALLCFTRGRPRSVAADDRQAARSSRAGDDAALRALSARRGGSGQ